MTRLRGSRAALPSLLMLCLCFHAETVDAQADFIRGDCNQDGIVDVADAVNIWAIRFNGAPQPCIAACEADGDSNFNGLVDGLYLAFHLFDGGPPPAPPFPDCGPDPGPAPLPCGTFDCSPPTPPTPDPDYTLSITDAVGDVTIPAEVAVLLDSSEGDAVTGWSYGVCHDGSILEVLNVVTGAAAAALNDGDGPNVDLVDIVIDEGWSAGTVVHILGADILDPGPELELHTASYAVIGTQSSTLSFCDTLGSPAVSVVVVVDNAAVTPVTIAGTVFTGPTFIRGDADGDTVVNGLVDSLFILQFQFQGGVAPPCLEAADTNGDGTFSGLQDALYLLSHQFQGSAPPPAPYPDCGGDPDPAATLDCPASTCP